MEMIQFLSEIRWIAFDVASNVVLFWIFNAGYFVAFNVVVFGILIAGYYYKGYLGRFLIILWPLLRIINILILLGVSISFALVISLELGFVEVMWVLASFRWRWLHVIICVILFIAFLKYDDWAEKIGSGIRQNKECQIEHKRWMNEFRANLRQWDAEGYSGLKGVIAIKNFDQMERKFSDVERKIKTLKTVESALNRLSRDFPDERAVFELEMESIRKKYKDLSKVDEVESEIKALAHTLTEYRRGKDEIFDRIAEVVKI